LSGLALVAGVVLVVLHRADGGEVAVVPGHVTNLHSAAAPQNKVVVGAARCVLGLDDGKYLSVLEACGEVRRLLEEAAGR
jgi:hypothetical protein